MKQSNSMPLRHWTRSQSGEVYLIEEVEGIFYLFQCVATYSRVLTVELGRSNTFVSAIKLLRKRENKILRGA